MMDGGGEVVVIMYFFSVEANKLIKIENENRKEEKGEAREDLSLGGVRCREF